jgi:hypothetical protein
VTGNYGYDTATWFSSLIPSLFNDVQNPYRFKQGAALMSYQAMFTGFGAAPTCLSHEFGIKVVGALTAPTADTGDPTKLVYCLDSDAGPLSNGNFLNDFTAELNNTAPASMEIATAELDSVKSKLKVT